MCLGREEDKKPRHRARANKRALLIKVRRPVLEIDPPTSGRHFYRLRVWLTRASNEKILWHRGEKERVSVLDQPIFESLEIFPLRLNLPLNPFSSLSLSFSSSREALERGSKEKEETSGREETKFGVEAAVQAIVLKEGKFVRGWTRGERKKRSTKRKKKREGNT